MLVAVAVAFWAHLAAMEVVAGVACRVPRRRLEAQIPAEVVVVLTTSPRVVLEDQAL